MSSESSSPPEFEIDEECASYIREALLQVSDIPPKSEMLEVASVMIQAGQDLASKGVRILRVCGVSNEEILSKLRPFF